MPGTDRDSWHWRGLKYHPHRARQLLFKRDGGICAECGVDTIVWHEELRGCLERLREDAGHPLFDHEDDIESVARSVDIPVSRLMGGSLWDVDHIKPICEGGRDELDNMQTLCVHCHRQKTNEEIHRKSLSYDPDQQLLWER